jgi:hypothetical protein
VAKAEEALGEMVAVFEGAQQVVEALVDALRVVVETVESDVFL